MTIPCGSGAAYTVIVDWDADDGPLLSTFEDGIDGWVAGGTVLPTLTSDTAHAHDGTRALLVAWGTGGTTPNAARLVTDLTIGTVYTVSAYAWVPTGDPNVFLDIEGGVSGSAMTTKQAFAQLTLTFTATATSHNLRIRPSTSPTSPDRVWLDSVRVLGPGEDVTTDVLERSPITTRYGRDQSRSLSPTTSGEAAFELCNADKRYTPENAGSLIFGDVFPGHQVVIEAELAAVRYPLFVGTIGDDFEVHTDRTRSVTLNATDALGALSREDLSTGLHRGVRTGAAIGLILDYVGWPAGQRRLDYGATYISWWWEDGISGLDAVARLVRSEGPPAMAYVAPDGTFVFEDRHHRLLNARCVTSQASFAAADYACDAPPVTGYSFTKPFTYDFGTRDVINSAQFSVNERLPSPDPIDVWTSADSTIAIANGQTVQVEVSGSDPFMDAVTPVLNVDYTLDIGAVNVSLNRTSGQSITISMQASGGAAVVRGLKLRARAVSVIRTVKVGFEDTESRDRYGRRSYTEDVPWAGVNDAQAIAEIIVGYRARPRPGVQLRVVSQDIAHLTQILSRQVSDRITIRNDQLEMDADFHIESISHTISSLGALHAVVFGCEAVIEQAENVFIFDVAGHGFNDGVFAFAGLNDPDTIFLFDVAGQGFNDGMLAH